MRNNLEHENYSKHINEDLLLYENNIDKYNDLETKVTIEKAKQKDKIFFLKKKLLKDKGGGTENTKTLQDELSNDIGNFTKINKRERIIDLMRTKIFKRKLKMKAKLGLANEQEKQRLKRLENYETDYKLQIKKMKDGSFQEHKNGIFVFQINKGGELAKQEWLKKNISDNDYFVQLHIENKKNQKGENYNYINFLNVLKQFAKKFPNIKYAAGESRLLNNDFIEYYRQELIKEKGKDTDTPSIIQCFDNIKPYFIESTYKTNLNSNGLWHIKGKTHLTHYINGYMQRMGLNILPEGEVIIDLDKIRNS